MRRIGQAAGGEGIGRQQITEFVMNGRSRNRLHREEGGAGDERKNPDQNHGQRTLARQAPERRFQGIEPTRAQGRRIERQLDEHGQSQGLDDEQHVDEEPADNAHHCCLKSRFADL